MELRIHLNIYETKRRFQRRKIATWFVVETMIWSGRTGGNPNNNFTLPQMQISSWSGSVSNHSNGSVRSALSSFLIIELVIWFSVREAFTNSSFSSSSSPKKIDIRSTSRTNRLSSTHSLVIWKRPQNLGITLTMGLVLWRTFKKNTSQNLTIGPKRTKFLGCL